MKKLALLLAADAALGLHIKQMEDDIQLAQSSSKAEVDDWYDDLWDWYYDYDAADYNDYADSAAAQDDSECTIIYYEDQPPVVEYSYCEGDYCYSYETYTEETCVGDTCYTDTYTYYEHTYYEEEYVYDYDKTEEIIYDYDYTDIYEGGDSYTSITYYEPYTYDYTLTEGSTDYDYTYTYDGGSYTYEDITYEYEDCDFIYHTECD